MAPDRPDRPDYPNLIRRALEARKLALPLSDIIGLMQGGERSEQD